MDNTVNVFIISFVQERVYILKKKLAIFLSIIIIGAGLCFGNQLWRYYHPDITVYYVLREAEDFHFEEMGAMYSSTSILGNDPRIDEKFSILARKNADMVEHLLLDYQRPMHIECEIIIEDGKTKVVYSGTARTDAGEEAAIYEEEVFDFVLAKEVTDCFGVKK